MNINNNMAPQIQTIFWMAQYFSDHFSGPGR